MAARTGAAGVLRLLLTGVTPVLYPARQQAAKGEIRMGHLWPVIFCPRRQWRRRVSALLAGVLLHLLAASPPAGAETPASGASQTMPAALLWRRAATFTPSSRLNRVVFGAGRFVAVGEDGTILASAEGVNWTASTRLTGNSLVDVAYGNGVYVAVGSGGDILVSTDRPDGEPDPVTCAGFPDVPDSDWACAALVELVNRQVVSGYGDGTFRPAAPVTRAELAKLLVPAPGDAPRPGDPAPSRDTRGHWAAVQGYLQAAVRRRHPCGRSRTRFRARSL